MYIFNKLQKIKKPVKKASLQKLKHWLLFKWMKLSRQYFVYFSLIYCFYQKALISNKQNIYYKTKLFFPKPQTKKSSCSLPTNLHQPATKLLSNSYCILENKLICLISIIKDDVDPGYLSLKTLDLYECFVNTQNYGGYWVVHPWFTDRYFDHQRNHCSYILLV